MAAGWTIEVLGRVAVGAVAPRARRVELVVAYLAAERHRPVTHDELADALWPEALPDTWEAALRGALTEVRRYLADCGLDPAVVLTTGRRSHQLALPDDVGVDLDDARRSLDEARALLAGGEPGRAATAAAAASALARLPFLPDHDGTWVAGIRRELANLLGRALEVEARARAAVGDHGTAAAVAAQLVELEPFNESVHQLRIRLLGTAGDRAGAVRAYEACRAVLAEELGIEPSAETTAALRDATGPAPTPRTPEAAEPPEPAGPLAHLSVLVVEDHDFQRRTAVLLLRRLGVTELAEASDGAAALDLLEAGHRPDVVLCDLDMPGVDGVEFIRRIAKDELAGAVVIASGLDPRVINAVRSVAEGYGLEVLGTIEKPLTARRLADLLTSHRPRARPPAARTGGPSTAAARAALAEGRLGFELEPAVDVATGAVTGARLRPSLQGADASGPDLVAALERAGVLGELGDRAVEAAATQLHHLAATGSTAGLTVDLPTERVHEADFADRAAAVLAAAGADPSRLTFVLAERAFRAAPAVALGLLTRLRVKGCGVGLAAFGVGHDPGGLLDGLPVTEVRLDPALVRAAVADDRQRLAVEAAIDAARRAGAAVVGDGCDDDATLELLLGVGCDRVAGARVAATVPIGELSAWLAGWDPSSLVLGGAQ